MVEDFNQLNKSLHSRVFKWYYRFYFNFMLLNGDSYFWEKKWSMVGRLRVFKWVKSIFKENIPGLHIICVLTIGEQLVDEFSDDEEQNLNEPGTPGIQEVYDHPNDFNQMEPDVENAEIERQMESEEARERREAEQDDIIGKVAATNSSLGNSPDVEGTTAEEFMDIS